MDRQALTTKLDRLLTMRGDPVKGLPATAWQEALEGAPRDLVMRAAIAAVRTLLVPDWADKKPTDRRPQRALETAEAWLAKPDADTLGDAKGAAKACTAARGETFGVDHRVPQAARSVAWAAGGKDETHLYETFATVEEELLARIALTAEYHRAPEQRRALVDAVKAVLVPVEAVATTPSDPSAADGPPVPYSVDSHFELGQRILHKKFGEVSVATVGETWVEVALPDGSKKRLAHKP